MTPVDKAENSCRVLLLVDHWDLDKLCQFPAKSDKVTQEGHLSWRCPMCFQSTATATESRRVKLAAVCRWLRKALQKGCLATAGSWAPRKQSKALEEEGGGSSLPPSTLSALASLSQ